MTPPRPPSTPPLPGVPATSPFPVGVSGPSSPVTADRSAVSLDPPASQRDPREAAGVPLAADVLAAESNSDGSSPAGSDLGTASALFLAVRAKHPATAAHCLRVARILTFWCRIEGHDDEFRRKLEIAALLHDVGRIGIPDRILRKPGTLTSDERMAVDLAPLIGVEILSGWTTDTTIIEAVRYCGRWFHDRRDDGGPDGNDIPLAARMLSIAAAFDAMIVDSVHRTALSKEAALGEVCRGAGGQFDPTLAAAFAAMMETAPEDLSATLGDGWLPGTRAGGPIRLATPPVPPPTASPDDVYFEAWLETTSDGIAFLDSEGIVVRWNDRMRLMTGIAADAMVGRAWDDSIVVLCDERGDALPAAETIFRGSVARDSQTFAATLCRRPQSLPLEVTVHPFVGRDHRFGRVVVLRDVSDEKVLEKEIQSLHRRSTLDPLTKVANRACFDATIDDMVGGSAGVGTFSLVICDIDHFKSVNDTHGHQAGDEALIEFAALLDRHGREGDLVARYGGEEFVFLVPNCDLANAAKRAEAVRVELEALPLSSLGNQSVTASFGVTEAQPGDTPETIIARADRALLRAKENGRNRVLQLGAGNRCTTTDAAPKPSAWTRWFGGVKPTDVRREWDIVTPVPFDLALNKLKGFVSDHRAEIHTVKDSQVHFTVPVSIRDGRRQTAQSVDVSVRLTLAERAGESERTKVTNAHLELEIENVRDRRGEAAETAIQQTLKSLQSYLMGDLVTPGEG